MGGAVPAGFIYGLRWGLGEVAWGEVFGTGMLGGRLGWPVAALIMGQEAELFAYVIPFLMSTMCGTVFAAFLMGVLCRSGVFTYLKHMLDRETAGAL